MGKKKKRLVICSNCLKEFPENEMHLVEFYKFAGNYKENEKYKKFICSNCIEKFNKK